MRKLRRPLAIGPLIAMLFVVGGCSGTTTATNDDKWSDWNSGETIPEMTAAAQQIGIEGIVIPTKPYVDKGYIGVARLGTTCLVEFWSPDTATSATKGVDSRQLNVTIESRYWSTDPQLIVVGPTRPISEGTSPAKQFIQNLRPTCDPSDA